ncbi:MAG: hypothetical protein CBHOC_2672 [uncultured Caballeronia sp.]|nr:MAG: hypothetical protein CBHOC_2672 [uncultured Caballeronia sp.]
MRHFYLFAFSVLLFGILSSGVSSAQQPSDAAAASAASAPAASQVMVVMDAVLGIIQAKRVDGSATQVSVPLDQVLRLQGGTSQSDRKYLIHTLIYSSFLFVAASLAIIIVVALCVRAAFWK